MTDLCEVVITAPDPEWLADFVRRLIEDRLVAGAHEVSDIRSIYRWQGEIVDRREARVALHTRNEHVPRIIERAGTEHPYDVPCVVALTVTAANPAYEAWVMTETGPDRRV